MKYYIIAGEASGDIHAANLMKALQQGDPAAVFRVWGGDLMEAAGGQLVKHYRDLAFMGFWEVLKNIRTILGNFRLCKSDITHFEPDVLILVDYPGFNLRMAKWAKAQGLTIFYYISPQIWAWHSSRVHQIKKLVDRMFVILPFEAAFYRKYQYAVDFVGHPLLDHLAALPPQIAFRQNQQLDDRPIIALLPGSRRQEITRILPLQLQMIAHFPAYQFVVAAAPGQALTFYQELIQSAIPATSTPPRIVSNQTHELLRKAQAALVTSGTATLETALLDVPQVVCYTGNPFSYWIARRLVNVAYISLVNLILDRPLIRELIQEEFNEQQLSLELAQLLDPKQANKIKEGYRELREKLGHEGASQRTATLMLQYLQAPSA
ncbi:MAG: lipid-A-disaccharide synthase [Bacteroidota bacterium]